MRKHKLAGIWHRYRDISLISLLLICIICGLITIFALRANNLKMIELRQAVYVADTDGGDVEQALNSLRTFVYSHMNTNLRAGSTTSEPPIQLVGRFNAAVTAEQARLSARDNSGHVYIDAQAQCERANLPLSARARCIQDYVGAHGSGIQQLVLPPKEFYTYDFASPSWSPDLAGWALVATLIFGSLFVLRIMLAPFINRYLRTKK